MNNQSSDLRRSIFLLLFKTTIVVLLLIGAAFLLSRILPAWKQQRVDSAIAAGDTGLARRLAERFDDEEKTRILQQCSYMEAESLEAERRYPEASALFAEAGNYEDAAERRKYCDYEQAALLEQKGLWDEASDAYRALGGYRDSADRVNLCRYQKAVDLLEIGDAWGAAELLDTLSSLPEAHTLLVQIVTDLTGLEEERALAAFHGMSEEQLALLSNLSDLRSSLPKDIIDVGFNHTVGLGTNGRVYACGDNSYSQCDTAQWNKAVAVAAGAWHTAALLSDGTVITTGRNTEGQCDTAEWRDIVQIAAGDYATFGLCRDGTILSTGFLDYEEIRDWSGMVSISAGSYGIAAQRNDGSLWFYPEMNGADALKNVEQLALNTGYAVAVMKDGSVSSAGCELPEWKNVLMISASGTAVLALESGGFVDALFFRDRDRIDFSTVMDAVAIAAGGTHFAVVFSDGRVQVFGCSEHGEADTEGWVLAVN